MELKDGLKCGGSCCVCGGIGVLVCRVIYSGELNGVFGMGFGYSVAIQTLYRIAMLDLVSEEYS